MCIEFASEDPKVAPVMFACSSRIARVYLCVSTYRYVIGYRSINLSITIEKRSTTIVRREDARPRRVPRWRNPQGLDRFPLSPAATRQKGSRTVGNAEGARLAELPRLHLTERPTDLSPAWPYPHQISSRRRRRRRRSRVPSYVIPALRQLIYL